MYFGAIYINTQNSPSSFSLSLLQWKSGRVLFSINYDEMSISFQTDGAAFDQKIWDGKWFNIVPLQKVGRNYPSLSYGFRGTLGLE